jgi:hypothetical protein
MRALSAMEQSPVVYDENFSSLPLDAFDITRPIVSPENPKRVGTVWGSGCHTAGVEAYERAAA